MIPIRKITAVEAVVENLKKHIRNGDFGPGDQLPSEPVLQEKYGVSRLTLREALARLAALGIINVRHGKGAFVTTAISLSALDDVLIPMFPQHDLNRMNDLVEARNLIESEMASKVAEKRTDEQIACLESLLSYDDEILDNPEMFAERDYAFHFALAQMAGNQFSLTMYQALYRHIRAFLVQYARSIDDRKEALERHRPILKAIIDQDADKARKLAREHAGICASFIKKMINIKE
ncbi:MAG: FadR family transcriptional regulator [Deltaproteobacteria bacterium]|nr:FadR family transcriptional regulator [Deltaproteobacteria bacterium]